MTTRVVVDGRAPSYGLDLSLSDIPHHNCPQLGDGVFWIIYKGIWDGEFWSCTLHQVFFYYVMADLLLESFYSCGLEVRRFLSLLVFGS